MKKEFTDVLKARRTHYALNKEIQVSDEAIQSLLEDAVLHTPSAFNSQSARVVLLLNGKHDTLWSITREALRKIVPAESFKPTDDKINGFAAAYGTVLFFEDTAVVKGLQEAFPLYQHNFPIWSTESSGMLQYVVWSGLTTLGVGASLQHYNELIEENVKETFELPENWKLVAQMPFGNPSAPLREKEFLPLDGRLLVQA
ncbi:MAG: nitroreductase [Firmicutes bacterium GWF2_51_9]|nr:nitroreductase family protein [Erysipelotrichaceae bacterium]OGS54876.1 MAG: nitroreductase [Firmicutes bacterium GWF2_51_9]OGS59417.1 MAG: nitroreductase [Firmicutes bacterium GWE2_51_13]HAM63116.1 nitroreductase [Erysipelotrichaceae bacterium]HBZ41978.1 nitroreductase [Erysipelotrichaceae bacterium]